MFFSVKELEHKQVLFDVSFPAGEIDFSGTGLRQLTNLDADGSVELLGNTLGEIRIKGSLKVTMGAECDRCLEPAQFPIHADFDLFHRPAVTPGMRQHVAEEIAIDEGESEIAFYEGAGLALEDVLREHILLSMPMQRVCSEACQGICPECGQNRNLARCTCRAVTSDDRWSALKKLTVRGI